LMVFKIHTLKALRKKDQFSNHSLSQKRQTMIHFKITFLKTMQEFSFKTRRALTFFAFFFFVCAACNSTTQTLSILSVGNMVQVRDAKAITTFHFAIIVNPICTRDIRVNYNTIDGTATSGKDYIKVSGTLTIPANQLAGYIFVIVTADSLRRDDQIFTLELSSPVNATLSTNQATGTIQNLGTYLPIDSSGYTSVSSYPGMKLVWSDEFNGKTLDDGTWTHETGGSGWGNNELEYYTNSLNNSFLTGGYLVIEARKETMGSNNYTSARIISKDKKTFTYGRIDFRARLPKGQGLWPALWMLGNNISQQGFGWPACGEIDIMELLGQDPQKVYGTVHWGIEGQGSTHIGGNYSITTGDFSTSFHLFSLQWDTNKMTFLVDNVAYFTASKTDVGTNYPFDKPFFFIMNVAVGGNWPGNPIPSTTFPQRMIVDYVRVFQ
jgi:beta-glucanase (GH16 family)